MSKNTFTTSLKSCSPRGAGSLPLMPARAPKGGAAMKVRQTFVHYMLFAALLAVVAVSDHIRSVNRRSCELQQANEYELQDALWRARARSLLPGD